MKMVFETNTVRHPNRARIRGMVIFKLIAAIACVQRGRDGRNTGIQNRGVQRLDEKRHRNQP
jgi:hypothetical protein